MVGGDDPAAQAHFVLDKIEGALHSLGARLEDVVRTRVYVRDLADWEPVARAHGERFRDVRPANTLVQAGLVGDEYRVEMEAEALVGGKAVALLPRASREPARLAGPGRETASTGQDSSEAPMPGLGLPPRD